VKILYHHRILSADGQFVHVRELVEALRRRGHEVEVVGPEIGTADVDQPPVFRAFRSICPKALYELLEIGYNLIAMRRLRRAIRKAQPDIIYERYNLFLFAGLWARWWYRVPLLLEVNAPLAEERGRYGGGLALRRLARWSEARTWGTADGVFTVTGVLAEQIAATGVDPERIVVTPNGVDLQRFQTLPSSDEAKAALGLEGKRIVGFSGFARPWHGLEAVVDWLASAAPDDAVLLVVGDGPAISSLREQAQRLGVADRLILAGTVAPQSIPLYLASFDVALQPAVVTYASPLKIFEYMAVGRAILAPDQPNIREIFSSGQDAILFEPDNFADNLSRLIADPALRARIGAAARQLIKDRRMTWDDNAAEVENFVRALSSSNRPAAPRGDPIHSPPYAAQLPGSRGADSSHPRPP
jgi:glycosyltransferase involved in cell wall biosynthesis